jgi:hypothetical protein
VGLVKLYVVGGGNYARFWKYISPVFMGGLVIFGVGGGLTRFLRKAGQCLVILVASRAE